MLNVKPGDLLIQQEGATWAAVKILTVDPWPDGSAVAHCLSYETSPAKPTVESLERSGVRIRHAPIDAGSFRAGWEVIGQAAPSKDELSGFVAYLRLTDFARYLAVTGQDSKQVIGEAAEHYRKGCALGDQGRRDEAISEYGKALRLYPLLHEALDNRAFTYMELGRPDAALSDFQESLRVNPDGMTAFFSKGECLMKLGQLQQAEAIFEEGQMRFPARRPLFENALAKVRSSMKSVLPE